MGCPLQMSELSPEREGRKTLRGNGSGPGCRPALVSLRNRRDTEEETDRRVFGDELLYASVFFFFFPGSSGRGKDQPYTGHHRSMIAIAFQLHGTLKQQEGMKQHAVKLHSNNSLKTSMNDNQSKSLEMWRSIEQQTFKFGRITI